MREILFRGKSNCTYGKVKEGDWLYSMTISRHCYNDEEIKSYYIGCGNNTIDGKTIGQFTGLTDKNGTKIFEGDIVRCCKYAFDFLDETELDIEISVVEFKNGSFELDNTYSSDGYNELSCVFEEISYSDGTYEECAIFEVIGNIHDNPELLKEMG